MGLPTVTSSGSSSVTNTYQNDLLSTITHTNTSSRNTVYTLSYGPADLLTGVKVGSRNLVTNQYTSGRWTLAKQTYGNGDYWKYSYNNSDQLTLRFTNQTDSSGISYAYLYNSKGQLRQVNRSAVTIANEAITGSTLLGSESYSYDSSDRPVRTTTTDSSGNVTQDISWTYNSSEKVSSMTESIGSFSTTYNYAYDNDKRPVSVSFGGIIGAIAYDGFSRMISQTVTSGGNNVLTTDYTYRNIDGTHTSTQVASLSNSYGDEEDSFSYTYDANGNITGISGSQTAQYEYDALGQLVWEKNAAAGKAWQYSYDNGGNILSRTAYDYDGSNTTNPETVNYSYTDSTWGDLLTAYDGQAITYDGIGNPLSYRGWTMSWQGGRQLAAMTGSSSLSFDYGESGLRLSKTCTVDDSSTVHTYTWNGSLLSSDICGNTALYFHYDANGSPMGFTLVNSAGSTEYFYVRNLQGDILKVIDAAGTVHASYTYDAWGNILSSSGDLADVNPLRYRGYYYDAETGLYYLQSRYYDPGVGRFINADGYASTGQGILGNNMFAYCLNNPVNMDDPSGNLPEWVGKVAGIALGVAAGLLAAAVVASMAPAALCAATLGLTYLGMGYSLASTVATVGIYIVGANAVVYAADSAYTAATGESPMLSGFNGNETAYNTWQFASAMSLYGYGAMYNAGSQIGVCFVAGTLVATKDGHVPIEDIEIGDLVWAWDEETDAVELKPVVETYTNETTELVHVTVNCNEIISTPNHPFYSPVKGWTAATHLRAGDILVLVNGEYVVVEKVQHELLENPVKVFNFQVADYHTYFVGNSGVLVHNECGSRGQLRKNMLREGPPPGEGYQAHHGLPWNFREKFNQAGLNINNPQFGIWVKGGGNGGHQSWSGRYNNIWASFFQNNPNPSAGQIIAFFNKLNGR